MITEVPYPREDVYDFLDVMSNHEPFTNHMLRDWEYGGPDRGVVSRAKVKASAGGRTDSIEIEVVAAERPARIVERNVGAGGAAWRTARMCSQTSPAGGTHHVRVRLATGAVERAARLAAGPRDLAARERAIDASARGPAHDRHPVDEVVDHSHGGDARRRRCAPTHVPRGTVRGCG